VRKYKALALWLLAEAFILGAGLAMMGFLGKL